MSSPKKLRTILLTSAAVVCVVTGGAAVWKALPAEGGSISSKKAAFVDPAKIAFVRPGLEIKILSASAAADGTVKTKVRFQDLKGLPLDKDGITTPGALRAGRPGMLLAYLTKEDSPNYVNYITRVATEAGTGKTADQATSENNGAWVKTAEGEYEYTYAKKLPTGYDRTATHAVAVFSTRDLTEYGAGIDLADAVFHFVPDGSAAAKPRDIVRTQTCRQCHDNMSFDTHTNSGRVSVEVCVLCHNPKSFDPNGESLDMPAMIHRIHTSRNLPSVVAGGKFAYRGKDYSKLRFSANVRECTVCHDPASAATMGDHWTKFPSQNSCGSCHDDVNFNTGEKHPGTIASNERCSRCHIPGGDADRDGSVIGAHVIPKTSKTFPGVVFELLKVEDGTAGKKPTITFTAKDKAGNPLDAATMTQVTMILAGPTSDYKQYWSEDARKATPVNANGEYSYTFTNAIPADAKGSYSINVQGGIDRKHMEGTVKETTARDRALNKTIFFSVDGSKLEPRREVVSMAKCQSCHGDTFAFHGEGRNTINMCVTCHNPTNVATRYGQTIDFRMLLHRIHAGNKLEIEVNFGATRPYNQVAFPGNLGNCSMCHVNGSEQLPLKQQGMLPVNDPAGHVKSVLPTAAACLSCHSSEAAASHAIANTSALGESCAACHGPGKSYSVDRVHAQ